MIKLCAAALLLTLVGLVHGSDPLAKIRDAIVQHFNRREMVDTKQTTDECLDILSDYPDQCLTTLDDFMNVIAAFDPSQAIDVDTVSAYFDTVCSSECLGPQVELYECVGDQDTADLLNRGYCGESGGTNCFVLWLNGANNQEIVDIAFCARDGNNCETSCQDSLQATVDYLGCCASSFYDNPISPFTALITPQQFSACSIDLGEMCEGISGAGIDRTALWVLTIFVSVSALTNTLL